MTEITASTLLAEMKPAWRAALGDRVSHEYIAGFIRRNRQRLEAALDPIVAVLNAVPDVHVAELAEDVAKRLRGRSEIVNVLANAPHNFGVELDRQLPQVMLEYLPEGTGTPQRWAIYRRWSDDTEFRRQLRAQVYELLWERRPGWAAGASERAEERKTKETETRNSVRSVRLRSAATNLAHQRVQVAADSVAKLRHQDVERVLRETPAEERRQVAYILGDLRADLSSEIDEVMREVLGEPANWSEYGRQEIYEPGSRARREATLAEDAAERFQQGDFNALGAVPLPPSPECSVERALEAAAPMIAEAEREIAAAKGDPLPVVMVSLEAGGILLLSPLGFLGRDLFQIYRDATSRLQYVSYPKKGQRGIPKVVARAVLALERDGFEVRAETPEVVKILIVTGGLDHALPVGPPPPRAQREDPARPPTRTSDPGLIARVNALAADPPTSTLKYLVKTLRERGDLPLQVKDWKEGGWRPVETAIEEAEGKAARRLARKPKAERLRADGVERPAKDANEEHAAQALVQLANMDPDKAHEVNEAGFSKSDVATGHTLARRWEATGELTGDEWDWAVAVANKYRRQVGPLPESPTKSKRTRATKAPTMAWPPRQAIVIAWLVDDIEIVSIGRTDLGERPVTRDIKVPKAAMWMNSGTVEDVEEAEEYAAKDGHSVFVFPDDHPDPLGAAKQLIVEGPRDPLKVLVDRLHGEPPKAPNNLKHQRSKASGMSVEDRLFVGVMPTGIVYADRSREVDGDYARCAFLPFDTLALDVAPKCPAELLTLIKPDAARMIAKRGERFQISASGQAIVLGSRFADPVVPKANSDKKGNNPLSYAGHSLATVQDIAAFLRRSLGKLYERYMLNINVVRNVGDHSVMLTFYRVPPDASELEAANAKCKVRINIHGAGRTNGSTWPDDATPAELTAYTVWAHNAPKFRKRTGPPSVIVAAVSSWFVINIADLTGSSTTAQSGRLRDVRIDDMDAQVAREEAAMGNALRAERDREEAEWSGAVRRGVKAEIANGHDAETAKRIAVANLGKDFEYYDKRSEEQWGERP